MTETEKLAGRINAEIDWCSGVASGLALVAFAVLGISATVVCVSKFPFYTGFVVFLFGVVGLSTWNERRS